MNVTFTKVRMRTIAAATLSGLVFSPLLFSQAAFADKGGIPNEHASDKAKGAEASASSSGDSGAHDARIGGRQVLLSGIVPSATVTVSSLQFTNAGQTGGTATVTLYDAATGKELAAWTSASIAPKASLLVDAATIAAKATPALTATQAGQALTLSVDSTIHGTVQLLQLTGGVLSNVSPCGPGLFTIAGGVPGPGSAGGTGIVKLTNRGATAAHAALTLYDSATGAKLGVWSSPDLPAHGSLMVSATAIAAAAAPVVAPATASFTVTAGPGAVAVQVLSMPKAGGAATSLDNACTLKGAGVSAHTRDGQDDEGASDEGDGDEDDSQK